MNNEERASKLCEDVEAYLHSKNHYNFGFELQFREKIAAEIADAIAESEAGKRVAAKCISICEGKIVEVRAQAFEEAAKLTDPYGDVGREIARDIRARAKQAVDGEER